MDFKQFSKRNIKRCVEGFKHKLEEWSIAEWTNAMCGEAGEAANMSKKLIRIRDEVVGNKDGETESLLRCACMDECADVIIYADLCIQALGGDTSQVIENKFERTSKKIGWKG